MLPRVWDPFRYVAAGVAHRGGGRVTGVWREDAAVSGWVWCLVRGIDLLRVSTYQRDNLPKKGKDSGLYTAVQRC